MDRRDPKIDALLEKQVTVEFWDGDSVTGLLGWQGEFCFVNPTKPFCYNITRADGSRLYFKKSHVRHISEAV